LAPERVLYLNPDCFPPKKNPRYDGLLNLFLKHEALFAAILLCLDRIISLLREALWKCWDIVLAYLATVAVGVVLGLLGKTFYIGQLPFWFNGI
jgi:hypothetical protein